MKRSFLIAKKVPWVLACQKCNRLIWPQFPPGWVDCGVAKWRTAQCRDTSLLLDGLLLPIWPFLPASFPDLEEVECPAFLPRSVILYVLYVRIGFRPLRYTRLNREKWYKFMNNKYSSVTTTVYICAWKGRGNTGTSLGDEKLFVEFGQNHFSYYIFVKHVQADLKILCKFSKILRRPGDSLPGRHP